MTMRAAAATLTTGAVLLGEFLDRHDITQEAAAQGLKVTNPAVNDWVNGKKRPEPDNRNAIAIWTSGFVPVEAWLRDAEAAKVANVRPFVAAADESGEHASVPVPRVV